ncbi:MAG: NAD(P)-dependent oxidoreductase [Prevotella sp.]|nr:NAD(P)-dependent oxidoreductase [Prevotella sp.]
MNVSLQSNQRKYLASKFKGSSILVSGSTGLIGSRIVHYLCELNDVCNSSIKIIALYKNKTKKDDVFKTILNREDISFIECDILFPLLYNATVDYVIHCAGISGGTKLHLKNPMLVFETAYNGTKNLLDFSKHHYVKGFCFVSTYEIYGNVNTEQLIPEGVPCQLNTMVLRNIYAECKRMCESMCVAMASTCKMNVFIGRLTSTFGKGVQYNDPRFFAEFARCIVEHRDIILKSMGGTVRSYLDADDAASAFLYILTNGMPGNAYNITNMANAISIRDIALRMIELSGNNIGLKFDVLEDIAKIGYRIESTTLMDANKLYGIGWNPIYSMDDTLKKLLNDFSSYVSD